jgi:hypothetical protein
MTAIAVRLRLEMSLFVEIFAVLFKSNCTVVPAPGAPEVQFPESVQLVLFVPFQDVTCDRMAGARKSATKALIGNGERAICGIRKTVVGGVGRFSITNSGTNSDPQC